MLKKLLIIAAFAAFIAGCTDTKTEYVLVPDTSPIFAQEFTIDFVGPGGHSNGAYGRVNAVHAASRAAISLEKNHKGAAYKLLNISGGNSVNSIAFDGKLVVMAVGSEATINTFADSLTVAINDSVAKENTFREVKEGQTDANGMRLDIRATVTKGERVSVP